MSSKLQIRGFTLIEMLVVISIVGMLSSLLIVNYRRDERSRKLRNSTLLVLDGIKKVQTMSFAGRKVSGQFPVSYSFIMDNCTSGCFYKLVANLSDESTIDIETIFLSQTDVSMEIIDGLQSEIIFSPPRGNLEIENDGFSVDDITFKLEHPYENDFYCLVVNRVSGRMDIISNCPN